MKILSDGFSIVALQNNLSNLIATFFSGNPLIIIALTLRHKTCDACVFSGNHVLRSGVWTNADMKLKQNLYLFSLGFLEILGFIFFKIFLCNCSKYVFRRFFPIYNYSLTTQTVGRAAL